MVAAPPVPTIDPPGPQGPTPAHAAMTTDHPAAGMMTKSGRAGQRAAKARSATPAVDQHAMAVAAMKAHADQHRANAATTDPTAMDGPAPADRPVAMTLLDLAHRAVVMTALATACVEPSGRMTATDQLVHPLGVRQGLTSVGESAANVLMTAAAMVIGLRAHRTEVPTGVPTGPIRANPVLISAGTMTGAGAAAEISPIGVDLSATTPPIGADKASAGRQNESRKPNLTMCASTVSSPMPAFAAAARPMTSSWPVL